MNKIACSMIIIFMILWLLFFNVVHADETLCSMFDDVKCYITPYIQVIEDNNLGLWI